MLTYMYEYDNNNYYYHYFFIFFIFIYNFLVICTIYIVAMENIVVDHFRP